MRRLCLLFLLLAAVLTAGCSNPLADRSAQGSQGRTVRIAYLPITHALPLFAEKELLSADDNVQIELVKYGSWPELMDALNTGKVDGASVLIELAVKAREQGIGNNLRADWLMAAILTIGVLGLLLDGGVRLLEGRIYRLWGMKKGTSL
ncbi:hypothetical protein SELR_14520 [Selenomonas ruminantium subsp. lactilytica TAM6421]|uniref:NitT/TauT family transport system substrate-binding protein n=1 Tax=Selenomonas ruminantium subsp. lactilytica (strain NBRC 103574 / TAM6421) TaxID=927704 RepID=I0GQX3_SELRL|nr:ABC transporter substrate-binding protein [Selenomonas ruminantium]BAL83160.1 hypothetical protein SELR_14520 [Selenomonas ruminantium subsp. lactilytica TAM6421]